MRAAILLLALCACATAAADEPAREPRKAPLGFDHAIHARDVDKKSAPAVPCARCHAIKGGVLAKPGHAACFDTCHPPMPSAKEAPAEARLLFCNPCHAETALANPKATKVPTKALAVPYPPYDLAPDFARQLGHKSHAQIACAQCHDPKDPRAGRSAPHRRCTGCHDGGKSFAITACEKCHPPGAGRPQLARKPEQLVVTSAFSHARHGTRGAAKQCITCHAPIAATDARTLPRPTVATCALAGCHDATAAFGVTAACTKCHRDVPAEWTLVRSENRFSHATHDKQPLPCTTCHPLAAKGAEVLVANHAPCAPCHAQEFGEREPKRWICSACHNGSEPWRPLVADRQPADTTEFGVTLDHTKHSQVCSACHVLSTSTSELRPPRGHVACTTAGCHAVKGGPAPQLGNCEGCHQRGVADARETARRTATWSVRPTFEHAPHRREKSGAELACKACHTDMTAPTLLSLATPAKATCARCHDGTTAFKLTGTSCIRCHGTGR